MFKFKTITATDLQKIYTLKRQANQSGKIKNVNELGGTQTDLVMPHDSYVIGLSSLKSEEEPKPQITGTQIIDASEKRFNSIFNLYFNDQLQMLNDKKYLRSYENAFDKILHLDVNEQDYEVRSIKIPVLHVEALWLHKINNEDNDLFTPIRSMGLFEDDKTYNRKNFFEILKEAVVDFDLNDDLIGG